MWSTDTLLNIFIYIMSVVELDTAQIKVHMKWSYTGQLSFIRYG